MMELTLTRDLDLWVGNVQGEIAFAERREVLCAVVLRVHEVGEADLDDVASHLRFDSSPTTKRIAARLLDICETHGLLESNGRRFNLTDAGKRVAETQRVFVPQKGAWTIWASEDPLLRELVVEVKPFTAEPSAYDEVMGKRGNGRRLMHGIPFWLRKFTKQTFSTATSRQPTRIDELGKKAEPAKADAALRLDWNVGAGELRLVGNIGKDKVDAEIDVPDRSPDEVWHDLLEGAGLWDAWDAVRNELRVRFDDTSKGERQTMVQQLTITPIVPGYGTFDPVTLKLPINAATSEDAERWAEWRLAKAINDYATQPRYAEWSKKASAPFGHFNVSMPTRADLARRHGTRGDTPNWHLIAAEDWRL